MNDVNNTVEALVEHFYAHCPLARLMVGRPLEEIDSKDVEHAQISGADMDCDQLLVAVSGESMRWDDARMKLTALARHLNRFLYKKIDGKGLPQANLGSPGEVKAELIIGRDMSGLDNNHSRFANDGESILLFDDHRAFFTRPNIVDLGMLDNKPVYRIRMEMYYYVLKEKDKA